MSSIKKPHNYQAIFCVELAAEKPRLEFPDDVRTYILSMLTAAWTGYNEYLIIVACQHLWKSIFQ